MTINAGMSIYDYYSLPENVRTHAYISTGDEHSLLSPTVASYNKPAPVSFLVRIIRAVEIANGLPPVSKIRVTNRMTQKGGLYYHRGEIAIAARLSSPHVALHEVGHHWHMGEGEEERDYRTQCWQRSIDANDISNNYERYYVTNVKERIAESFALFMVDPSVLSEAKRKYFVGQGLQSYAGAGGWSKEFDKLQSIPHELLMKAKR